jgi:hypothetical protein
VRDTTKDLNQILAAVTRGESISKLAAKVLQLQTADKFRLAGELLAFGHVNVAKAIAERAVQEIELAELFGVASARPESDSHGER